MSSDLHIRRAIACLATGEDLGAELSAAVVSEIMAGACEPAQVGAFLLGLAQKGETAEEIRGAASAMRDAAVRVPLNPEGVPAIDTCGTGGSGVPRRNVSTAAAIAIAACGVRVAKHGNRAASSRSGSADVLEALGVRLDVGPAETGRCVDEVGVGFLFARALHPAMRHAAPVRRALGVRTIFNLLGPLCNPARVRRQVIGVFDPRRANEMALALGGLGSERVLVLHGFRAGRRVDELRAPFGIDDASLDGETLVAQWRSGGLTNHVLTPADAGLDPHPLGDLVGGDPGENADALRRVLEGEPGAYRAAVCYAGALGLLVAGEREFDALPELSQQIASALDDGRAAGVLERLVAYSAEHGSESA